MVPRYVPFGGPAHGGPSRSCLHDQVSTRPTRHRHAFAITTGSGHSLAIDNAGGDTGPRPAELLLAAQAGCTALDVAAILAKRHQSFSSYEVSVIGDQREDRHPHVYVRIDIVHEFEGADLEVVAVRRAIELSATRYCTVSAMLSAGPAEVHHRYLIRRADGRPDESGEVVVTGPGDDPDAAGRSSSMAGITAWATQ